MLNIIRFIILAVGCCDQISYNRLNNNVRRHVGIRTGDKVDYLPQIYQWVMEQDGLPQPKKRQWLRQFIKNDSNNKKAQNKRLKSYLHNKRAMIRHRRKNH